MKEQMLFIYFFFLACSVETQKFKAEMIISAYYGLIMCPYLNFNTSHPRHIVMHFTTVELS